MRPFASLRRKADFARLRSRGRRFATPHLTFFRSEAGALDTQSLVGISVSKSVGTAVVRNRVRRRLAACLQDHLSGDSRMRLLISARPSAAAATYEALCEQVRRAIA
ncbi:MAG TPA: ribonuclease P protein component [Candidatus Baltobacteraceae bacterium]|jgi:ribonuclease P protein component|nr:ribonuclease P protein component [Candidatus Baltobacteraceae bacterium]